MIRRLEYKWIVGIVFVFGLFMDLLDMTIINVAIPTLAKDFDATTTQVQWVVTGYLLSLAVFIPVSGWLGRPLRHEAHLHDWRSSCSRAPRWPAACRGASRSLIVFRVLQGVGGGMLTPVGTAMLFRAFPPHERAKASAILMIPMVVAPASGPVLGGYLVEYQDWHWIFLINIPVGVLGFIFAGTVPAGGEAATPGPPRPARISCWPALGLGLADVRARRSGRPRPRRHPRARVRRRRPGHPRGSSPSSSCAPPSR